MTQNEDAAAVELYRHDPKTLLPLLEKHLPLSLPVYATIKINPWENANTEGTGTLIRSSTSESNDAQDATSIVNYAWATFPPSELNDLPEIWTIIIHLPPPGAHQTRMYCSSETYLHQSCLIDHPSQLSEDDSNYKLWSQSQVQVNGAIKLLTESSPGVTKLGAVHTFWTKGVAYTIGVKENVICDAYLAPIGFLDTPEGAIKKEGLIIDKGKRSDCEMVSKLPPSSLALRS